MLNKFIRRFIDSHYYHKKLVKFKRRNSFYRYGYRYQYIPSDTWEMYLNSYIYDYKWYDYDDCEEMGNWDDDPEENTHMKFYKI